jgi:hypothetical protein
MKERYFKFTTGLLMLGFVLLLNARLPKTNFGYGLVHTVNSITGEISDDGKVSDAPCEDTFEPDEKKISPEISKILRRFIGTVIGS